MSRFKQLVVCLNVIVLAGLAVTATRSWSTPAQAAVQSSLADAIVGDWSGDRLIPMSNPARFDRNRYVFMRFTSYGLVIMRIEGQIGTQTLQGAYEVSGKSIVLAGCGSSNTNFSCVMSDVSIENNQLRFVMTPSPQAFTQDAYTATYSLTRQ